MLSLPLLGVKKIKRKAVISLLLLFSLSGSSHLITVMESTSKQGTEGSHWPTPRKELRPSAQQPTENWIWPTTTEWAWSWSCLSWTPDWSLMLLPVFLLQPYTRPCSRGPSKTVLRFAALWYRKHVLLYAISLGIICYPATDNWYNENWRVCP